MVRCGPASSTMCVFGNKYLNTGQSAVEDFLSFLHFSPQLLETFVDDTKVQKDPDTPKLIVVVPETHSVKTCRQETVVTSQATRNWLWSLRFSWWSHPSHQSGSLSDRRPRSLKPWEHPAVSWPSQTAGGQWSHLLPTVPVFTAEHHTDFNSTLNHAVVVFTDVFYLTSRTADAVLFTFITAWFSSADTTALHEGKLWWDWRR